MPAIDHLRRAAMALSDAHEHLRLANREATPLAHLLLLQLIQQVSASSQQATDLLMALVEKETETKTGAAALRTAIEDVLLGSRLDAHGNRDDDGLRDFAGREATEHQIDGWTRRLQDGLEGKVTPPR